MQDNLERQLVDAAVGGDLESFGELCRRYYGPMVAIAYSVVSDHQLAEDAARFAPWLAAICRNAAKDMVAVKARRVNATDLSQAARDNNDGENNDAIRRAIEQLPAAARELIVLRYYNNLSYKEIASLSGISRAVINGRLARAKRKMADYLRRNGFPRNRL